MSRFNLNTGDLLLFDYHGGGFFGVFTGLIKYFTKMQLKCKLNTLYFLKDLSALHLLVT